ncbi:MAG: (Fe-S)-binding protein [Myxococcales bacterium]|nr:MAG: (Fe-S)-binding protein [Myxococcales bacterium]
MEQAAHLTMGTTSTWLFLAALVVGLGVFLYVFYYRLQIMLLGGSDNRFELLKTRIWYTIKYAFGQARMPDELSAGILHILIFVGFMTLSIRTIVIFGQGFGGTAFSIYGIPVLGYYLGPIYAALKELVVIGVLIGCAGFAWRRIVSKPVRMQNIPVVEPVLILTWISGLMVADIFLEAGLHAMGFHEEGFIKTVPGLGSLVAPLFNEDNGKTVWEIGVWAHSVMILIFLNYLPFGKHFHIITAIPNVFFANLNPYGRLRPILDIEERFEKMDQDPNVSIGYKNVEQYAWKEILDFYSCTECGRCVPFCPAWATQKPLSLKRVNKESKHHMYERAPYLLGKKVGPDGKAAEYEGPQTAGGAIEKETIWACTLCRDCEERCPVLIEQVPRIVDLRRHLVMMEGDIPSELNNTFRGWERNSNPWSLGYDKRGEWITEDLGVQTLAENADVDYLFYVGCMGSFDDRSTRVTKALCKILKAAGVRFGVLGMEEQCCGETARRLGNEFLGQMLVKANIETMQNYKVKKVICFCPHCFNTLKNEYADFGMKFEEVWHAADFVAKLLRDGKIKVKADGLGDVAFHDPCFLGRYNGVYEAPRDLLKAAGATVRDPSLARHRSFCCGAGGGRMWMEEAKPRVNDMRFKEIMDTTGGPKLIGVSCPYCLTMILDGSKNANMEDNVKIKDVLELVAERLDTGADA